MTRKPRRPLLQNVSLTAQTISEHVVDDPMLLALQVSRRLPVKLRSGIGNGLARIGAKGPRAIEALGLELAGNHEGASQALEAVIARIESEGIENQHHRLVPHVADIALSIGDPDRGATLLTSVPKRLRRAPWYATAARLALYRGDHDLAVEFACRHPRNAGLAKRMVGERDAFTGYTPEIRSEGKYAPVKGRILHVLTNSLPHTTSGYAQRSHSVLRSLVDLGYEVRAVTRPGYPAQVGVLWGCAEDTVDGITYVRLSPNHLAQGLKDRLNQHAELLADEVRKYQPAVLHTTTHFTNALVVQAVASAFGIPWIYEVRGQLADTWASTRGPDALVSQRYRDFVRRELEVSAAADAVVTLGENMKDKLVSGGVSADQIMVCSNAVGPAFIKMPPTLDEARAKLGLNLDNVYVGTVSSIVFYEGLDLLLRAAAKLAADFPTLRVRIAGDGVELPKLKVLAADLGISDLCEFPGRVPRSEAIWNHAALNIFVVPRKDLSVTRSVTPMKTVEASAVGRPVVASRLPALEELVVDGETGVLFTADDVSSLADALEGLLANPLKRAKMGAAARRWALETRTWAANAKTYSRVYEHLTGTRTAR